MNIAVVIPCYKRVSTLNELGESLLNADYCHDKVDLVFSIDYSGDKNVPEFAEDFKWPFGEKIIIEHEKNIGLRNNILYCGDLTSKYDAVIIIEDDLEVMPSFYRYAKQAAGYYNNDDRIGGISIYAYHLDEITFTEFHPFYEGYDSFFVKWASSWGQLWTRNQWKSFREWLKLDKDISTINIPRNVIKWNHSWKKYYIAYLTDTNRYFVFPFFSHVYNGNKAGGQHTVSPIFEVLTSSPLSFDNGDYKFLDLDKAIYKYDAFFQLEPKDLIIDNKTYHVEFDLYGHKFKAEEKYIITSKECPDNIKLASFDSGMLPLEQNILAKKVGNSFHLIESKNLDQTKPTPLKTYLKIRRRLVYYKPMLKMGFNALMSRIKAAVSK